MRCRSPRGSPLGAPFDEVEVLVAQRPQGEDPRRRERGGEVGPVVAGLGQRVGLAAEHEQRRRPRPATTITAATSSPALSQRRLRDVT